MRGDRIIFRHAIDLPLNKLITYIQQYQVYAQEMPVDPKQLMTVKSLPFIQELDTSKSVLSVSFLPDSVEESGDSDK